MTPELLTKSNNRRDFRSVPFSVLIHIAWRNLVSKKLRTILTVASIVIGVAAVFFLLSFGLGLRDIVTKEILGNQSVRSVSISTPNSKILKLNSASADRIKSLPHVSELSSSFAFPGGVSYNNSEVEGIVYGIDTYYQDMTSLNLVQGRLLQTNDVFSVLVNRSALKAMGITNEASIIGHKLHINVPLQDIGASKDQLDNEYTVVGVIDSGTGTEVFIPKFNFEALSVPTYSDIKLLADNTNNVTQLRSQIESLGFQTTSPIDTIDQINQVFRFFNVVLVGFGMIGMIVAILGMFNTLTISLLERTKEIGLMISLGGRPRDMCRLFIIEASLLSLIGSLAGIVIASGLAAVVNVVLYEFARTRGVTQFFYLFAMPWWLIICTILFMVGVGLLVVYFPAKRAQRINPIDALRRE
jgi:ABC-type antimicrobial peptide transport system permease subunit